MATMVITWFLEEDIVLPPSELFHDAPPLRPFEQLTSQDPKIPIWVFQSKQNNPHLSRKIEQLQGNLDYSR